MTKLYEYFDRLGYYDRILWIQKTFYSRPIWNNDKDKWMKTWWHSRKLYKKQNEIVVEPYHHIYYDSFPANISSAYVDPSTFFPF